MRIACLSDLHGYLPKSMPKDIDLIIIAGDICDHKTLEQEKDWLYGDFTNWLKDIGKPIFSVSGNHDNYLSKDGYGDAYLSKPELMIVLENDYFNIQESIIFGTPLSLKVSDNFVYQASESDITKVLENVRCDILISHGPIYHIGDIIYPSCKHIGSFSLRDYVNKNSPALVVTGHAHNGYGFYLIGKTAVVSASFLTEDGSKRETIIVIDYDEIKKEVIKAIEWDCNLNKYLE